ncbi:MAG: WbqC family protein [Candidatus Hydrogenedentes bacterium]|nr:WbqC family protein [Candidatus Hydrogenedentota bacterium]
MIVAALQAGYLPWLGFFDLMKRSGLFIIEDNLKYTKQDWRNRNRIRTPSGFTYLTVPVKKSAPNQLINEVEIDDDQPWRKRHFRLLLENYRHAPFWKPYESFLRDTYERKWRLLIELDLWFIEFFVREFGLSTPNKLLSEVPVQFGPDKTQSLIDLVRAVGGDTFLEGSSGRNFIETSQFEAVGLKVAFQDYVCKPYPQQFEPFLSHLSAIDLLLNVGPQGAELI